jgi:hypothetical protein
MSHSFLIPIKGRAGASNLPTSQYYHSTNNPTRHNPASGQHTQQLLCPSSNQDLERYTTTDMSSVPSDELAELSLNELYACTFLCGEAFPTAHEWRQHELRVHRQAEMWRCNIHIDDVGTECGEIFYTSANFETHLSATHGANDYDLEQGHIHPEGQYNFWCGFCKQIRRLSTRGVDAWTERLDHLQAHFDNGDSLEKDWLKLRD